MQKGCEPTSRFTLLTRFIPITNHIIVPIMLEALPIKLKKGLLTKAFYILYSMEFLPLF